VNLSTSTLGPNEISLLSKGLTFVPKPAKINAHEVFRSLDEFGRRLKLAHFFSDKKDIENSKQHLFREKSDWEPDPQLLPQQIHDTIQEMEEKISKIGLENGPSNLTKNEKMALKNLKNDPQIIIKPADKGSATVIMDRQDYLTEGNRQLSNAMHYRKIGEPVHPTIKNKVNAILKNLTTKRTITVKQLEYLQVPENPRPRKLYLLPKIHKDPDKWTVKDKIPPGRPIVSDCSSDTYRVAEYIDHFLAPQATKHASFVKDTPDFLKKISQLRPNPNSFLVTIDVDSLYTNIDNKEGLEAVRKIFELYPDRDRPDQELLDLLKLCLENNDFMFNGEWFLQIWGTAMGKKFAPNYANIVLALWESVALSKCPLKPDIFLRFLDDIFIVWSHSEEEFWQFFQILNNHHPTIKLKATIHRESIDFLDVTVFKGARFSAHGQLDTKVYFKPTDTHELLHKLSYHPKHTFKGILKSQIIRFHRICNNKSDFEYACTTLFRVLRARGYSRRLLRCIKSKTLKLLQPPVFLNTASKRCGDNSCKTCHHMAETNAVMDNKGKVFPLKDSMNCQSTDVVYLIQCSSCKMMYVGETGQTLHERFRKHRSDIKCSKSTPVGIHFNGACRLEHVVITPLELVKTDRNLSSEDILDRLEKKEHILERLEREQFWMAKLDTITPKGLNKKRELPPPIPFVIPLSDNAGKIIKVVREAYSKLKLDLPGAFFRKRFITAYQRNTNLKDMLVSTAMKDINPPP
jgi:hypothetical protein